MLQNVFLSGYRFSDLKIFGLIGMDDENDDKLSLNEMLDDKRRVGFYKEYLASVASAIK